MSLVVAPIVGDSVVGSALLSNIRILKVIPGFTCTHTTQIGEFILRQRLHVIIEANGQVDRDWTWGNRSR